MPGPASSTSMPTVASPPLVPTVGGPRPRPRSAPSRLPFAIGIAYVGVWIAGLCVWPSNLAVDSPAPAVLAAYRPHGHVAAVQYLLVEGIAGLLLGALALTLARRAARELGAFGTSRAARAAVATGLCASTVSVVQCILGMVLVASASAERTARTHLLFDAINRLDGGKMLLLAAAGCCVVAAGRPGTGRGLGALLTLAALSLCVSGVSYLLLLAAGGWTVYLSGPLLLAGVVALGRAGSRPTPSGA